MTSKSNLSYRQRAADHPNPLVRKLFAIAEKKRTNVVLSADLTTTKELLAIADSKSWSPSGFGSEKVKLNLFGFRSSIHP